MKKNFEQLKINVLKAACVASFIFLLLVCISVFISAATVTSSWIKINSTGVRINASYNETVTLVSGYPQLTMGNKSYALDTSPSTSGRIFISTSRTKLTPGTYTYTIIVDDGVGNQRNDSKTFEVLPLPPPPGCGNGVKNGTEECDDGNNLDGDGCSAYCKEERCSNSRVDAGEECDGSNLNGMSCTTIGHFLRGTLLCNANCTFKTNDCIPEYVNGTCGDKVLNDGEVCDSNDWGPVSACSDFSAFIGGTLKCNSGCHFDTLGCIPGNHVNDSCLNKKKDGDESDVDCGGSCSPCEEGKKCVSDMDCAALYCKNNVCAIPTCTDAVTNGLETDVDCGGSCPGCALNKSCSQSSDCASNFCNPNTKKCDTPSCTDLFQNGDETDVDCGGGCPVKCASGKKCLSPNDCQSNYCEAGICATDKNLDTDKDGMPDWWEDKYGLDKYDPGDANEDLDGDGYSNLEEYRNGTDPTDPDDPPSEESHTLQIILLILGLLLMIGSAGFLIYSRKVLIPQQKAKAQSVKQTASAQPTLAAGGQRPTSTAQITKKPTISPREALRAKIAERIAQRKGARKSLLKDFDKGQKAVTREAEESEESGVEKESPSPEYVAVSDLAKKSKAQTDEDKKAKAEKERSPKKQSAAFEKLKELSSKKK